MKAVLEFDLENEDDRLAHLRSIQSIDMALVLFEIQYNLKRTILREIESRYEEYSQVKTEITNFVFNRIDSLFEEHGINIDKLIK